jgi:predicted ATPase
MSGFKLIAIRPLIGCDRKFLKNLKEGQIYKFYNDFQFLDENYDLIDNDNFIKFNNHGNKIDNKVFHIRKQQTVPSNLYKNNKTNEDELEINISAIVGMNGSGKSTILELLYALCYVIASKKGMISNSDDLSKLIGKKNVDQNKLLLKIDEVEKVYEDLKIELIYEIDDQFLEIKFTNNKIQHRIISDFDEYPFKNGIYEPDDSFKRKFTQIYDDLFFYTISINYSLYGLNTENHSNWLFDLFHKNDGYQTPLVINPFRKKGNIDVNTEYHLAQSRLLSNLIDDTFTVKSIVNDKVIDSILFVLDYEKFNTLGVLNIDNVIKQFREEYGMSDSVFIMNIYNSLYREKELKLKNLNFEKINNFEILAKYVYRKVFKIAMQYEEYNEHFEIPKDNKPIPKIRSFFKQLLKLQDDRSHITLKLRQILNTLRFNILEEDSTYKWEIEADTYMKETGKIKKYYFDIKTDDFIERIKSINKKYPQIAINELIPAACFIPNLKIKNNISQDSISNFESLSSGEQQFVHSIQSILYHISNINSVFKTTNEKIKYKNLNLVLDEIELYYHPEFQRIFIFELLKGIRNLKIDNIKGINILFSTHSPFILSDIPHQNTLRLKEGKPYSFQNLDKTFGANIHDLLDNDFFLEEGFMGEWAKIKIQNLIEYLDGNEGSIILDKWNKDSSFQFIEIIGEPVLRNTLRDMYFKKFDDEIENEIERLTLLQNNKIK